MEPPVQHNGKKYLFGNQSPLLPVFLLQHKPPRAFGDLQWLLCRWHHSQERRGRSWCDCGARGGDGAAAAAAELRSLALEGLPAALLPLTASPSQPQRLMSAHFNESFSILILFFSWCTYWFVDNAVSPFRCITVSSTSICLYCWGLFL